MDAPLQPFKTPQGQARYLAAYDAALRLWPVPFEARQVATGYGQTHLLDCGPREAPPLLLLHGGYASATMWFPNAAHLSRRFRVLAPDTIGEPGQSLPARRNASRADCAAWLESVLDALGIPKVRVVGLSRGGWLGLNLALQAPERVEKLVLLSPAAVFLPLSGFFRAVAGLAMRVPFRPVLRAALDSWVTPGFPIRPAFANQFVTGLQHWNWALARGGYSGVMPCVFSDETLRQVRPPVLMLIGDHDRLNPPAAITRARRTVPHLEAGVVRAAGHLLSMEQPDLVDAWVQGFLEGK